jgi:hypothetical protein
VFLLRKVLAEPIEPPLPARSPLADPPFGGLQRDGLDLAGANPPDLLRTHEPTRLEHPKVLHHRRERHRQRFGEGTHGRGSPGQSFDHDASGWVRERLEDQIELG